MTVPIEEADLRLTTRVNLGEVKAAECSLAFTTRSEVSHGKR